MKMIVASTSTLYGGGYLEYLLPELSKFFENVSSLLFVPYARPGGMSHADYTHRVRSAFQLLGIEVKGIHEFDSPIDAVKKAEALFVGGGNTFVLLDRLYQEDLLPVIRKAVRSGTPYLGTSAGSNITGPNVMTTNDMPIVDPPSLKALDLLPFNINPHYLDPDPDSKHQGETRETRIAEFHTYNEQVVIGLREGSWIEVRDEQMLLKGSLSARIFKPGFKAYELDSGQDLSLLTGQQ
jgi:dipeptidase E